ncbi:Oidioi.mRNA.OKI2018_I69.XSR.g15296.t1.cds [Oikopleura dioica]|uniref:Oidioi.mRNA.OKI2018_I69.XSR.g15296.t1.cds n=1 Tax=Oikopleura dioica TaxID=34765 RepID=A0ABN7SGE4_OIKDI|nr:Oidioi.mRNA.OKI2018_I69.XSR.g15296.t1.cds [Oikopleura dioica]
MECSKCTRDFSPSWKYDQKGRLLCTKCINTEEFERQTISQIKKFNNFSDFWEKKEEELTVIELQMEKDQKELRQQQIEAEKIRQAKYRQQEKERKNNLMNGDIAGVNRTALENLMRSVNTGNRHRPKGNNIGQASTLMNQINQMTHEQTLQMIHRLHQMSNPSAANSTITADYLANLKVQKIKEQMMEQQKQKELQKQMELERIRKQKQREELVRSQLERQRQQQQQRQNNPSNSDLLRAISQIQNLTNLTQPAQNSSPAQNSGTQVNQQLQALQQLLAAGNAQPNLLTNLIASGILGGQNVRNSSQNYAELLKPPTAHTNKR